MYDVVIVGAGPAGLACAVEAGRRGMTHLVLEKGTLVNTIVGFPTTMIFFSTPELLELGGMPFTSPNVRPDRIEAVEYYHGVARAGQVNLSLYNGVAGVERADQGFIVRAERGGYRAHHVAIATGYFDQVNPLGIPGEELPKVSHYYREAYGHYSQDVLVIGGRNSAVETALDLWRHGARVTMVHRGDSFGRSVKYWIRPDIENRVAKGQIAMLWNTEAVEILPRAVRLRNRETGEEQTITNDFVYAMIGHRPSVALLEACGVTYAEETLVPTYDPATFETNVPGLFIAGSVACGSKTWEIFIENGRRHAAVVIAEIARRLEGSK
ncbi:MAG: YpdA family putative bacillithiol disulfide reductase [Bacteroidetes bacterium]|nr:YpdA family putative bacillithiol disulfide reductase [Bacteroidota bacterium]